MLVSNRTSLLIRLANIQRPPFASSRLELCSFVHKVVRTVPLTKDSALFNERSNYQCRKVAKWETSSRSLTVELLEKYYFGRSRVANMMRATSFL